MMFKKFLSTLTAIFLITTLTPFSYATNSYIPTILNKTIHETSIIPYADVIVYKFRVYNGKRQYRRWNQTRGYWVDSHWIDI